MIAGLVLVGASPNVWTDLGDSRQHDYISEAEMERMRASREELRALREEEGWSRDECLQLLIYNNFINGDWKRQHFYEPSPEQFAQIALYEWVNDRNFNSLLNQSAQKVDLIICSTCWGVAKRRSLATSKSWTWVQAAVRNTASTACLSVGSPRDRTPGDALRAG